MSTRAKARTPPQSDWLTAKGSPRKGRRGGARPGAGRPPKGVRPGAPHKRRPRVTSRTPLHIIVRIVDGIRSLRSLDMYTAIRTATLVVAQHEHMRIVEISIQRTHIHLIVEARDAVALARGMQAFQTSAARGINRVLSTEGVPRRGRVFADRYHIEIISSPTQARYALLYVLNNWRKHGDDRDPAAHAWPVDPFSSGVRFDGWVGGVPPWLWPLSYEPLVVKHPRSWLLREGWRALGLLDWNAVPGPRPSDARLSPPRRPRRAPASASAMEISAPARPTPAPTQATSASAGDLGKRRRPRHQLTRCRHQRGQREEGWHRRSRRRHQCSTVGIVTRDLGASAGALGTGASNTTATST